MGVFYESIPESIRQWIVEQKVFWVATAPLFGGHVNVSPKGGQYYGILDERTFVKTIGRPYMSDVAKLTLLSGIWTLAVAAMKPSVICSNPATAELPFSSMPSQARQR